MSELVYIDVPGTKSSVAATRVDDRIHIAVRPACEALGIDFDAQRRRLERQPWATVVITTTVGADGKARAMLTVDRRTFTMWLATIESSRIKNPAAREVLAAFQREAADAIDRYFHDGGAINPRADEHQVNALIFQSRARIELLQAARGLIHPDHLEAHARCVVAQGLGEPAQLDAGTKPLYAQDYLAEKNLPKSKLRSISGMFGKRTKAAYIERHGRHPQKYPLSLGNGQVREVNAYTEADRPLLDAVWDRYYGEASA